MDKLNIKELKKIIVEAQVEQIYHDKFIKNFVDVREAETVLTEEQVDSMADQLYELIIKKES